MLAEELRAAGRAAGDGFAGIVDRVQETHLGISERAFAAVGSLGAPAKLVHDAVSDVAYGSTRVIGEAALRAAGEVVSRAVPAQLPGSERRTGTRVLIGAVNGMYGDRLAAKRNSLATEMSVHVRGFPRARMAVFVHGLCETEDAWFLHAKKTPSYGDRLRDELGYTPVYIRYNSGLEVEANGVRLSLLLEDLVSLWPVELSEVTLIGHSMGGLVARAACAGAQGTSWGKLLRHVVALGTPHHGAPLEQTAEVAARVLSWVPETRGVSHLIESRSAGIKGLSGRSSLPYTPDVDHYFFSAGLTQGSHDAVDSVLGDLLVTRRSAWDTARGERVRFSAEQYRHIAGANHFDLLGHPAVADQLVRWLGVQELSARSGAQR